MMCIPQHVAVQLDLEAESYRDIKADGRSLSVAYVGPLKIVFENRMCFVGALVLGDEALLGAVPMEDLDVVISPARQTLIVNPESPNFAHSRVKTSQAARAMFDNFAASPSR